MAKKEHIPTVQGRRLAGELRRLRAASGLSREQAARLAGLSDETIRRGETPAECRLEPNNVWRLAQVYGVTSPASLDRLTALARGARQPGWWHEYDLSETHATFVALEAEAGAKRVWEPSLIPGLLQTEGYARAVIAAGPDDLDDGRVDRLVEVRMARRKILHRPFPLLLHAVIGEAVLARPSGSRDVMAAQLPHLADAAQEPNVTVQVLPFAAGEHPGLAGSFTILEYPDPGDHDVLYSDTLAGPVYAEKPRDIARAYRVFSHLIAMSLSPHDSIDLAARYAADM